MPACTDLLVRLDQIERELRQLGLWSLHPPTAAALASVTPFACDVMPLEMWLQWIFLPRMRETLRQNIRPPAACHIHAYAAHVLVPHGVAAKPLVQAIRGFDEGFAEWVEGLG
ncbi:MAG: YqcC family protein [Pseudomonadota bacterium]